MIQYRCPKCQAVLQSEPQQAGTTVACPTCSSPIVVPAAQAAAPAPVAVQSFNSRPQYNSSQAGGGTGKGTFILALLAFLGVLALWVMWVFFDNHIPGKGLGGYDFDSAKNALKSTKQMRANADFAAQMELQRLEMLANADDAKKVVESLNISKELDAKGKTAVLYSFKNKDGKEIFDVDWFEKKDGKYIPSDSPKYADISDDVKKQIEEWNRKGSEMAGPRPPF